MNNEKNCPENKILNVKTNRCVSKKGAIGKKIIKEKEGCGAEKILNVKTNRCVSRKGAIGKKILKQEIPKQEIPKQEIPKQEILKQEIPKQEIPKQDISREEKIKKGKQILKKLKEKKISKEEPKKLNNELVLYYPKTFSKKELKEELKREPTKQEIDQKTNLKFNYNEDNFNSPYEVFEINEKATHEEIKAKYKKLILLYHPDRCGINHPKEECEKMTDFINKVYKILITDDIRKKYDTLTLNETPIIKKKYFKTFLKEQLSNKSVNIDDKNLNMLKEVVSSFNEEQIKYAKKFQDYTKEKLEKEDKILFDKMNKFAEKMKYDTPKELKENLRLEMRKTEKLINVMFFLKSTFLIRNKLNFKI